MAQTVDTISKRLFYVDSKALVCSLPTWSSRGSGEYKIENIKGEATSVFRNTSAPQTKRTLAMNNSTLCTESTFGAGRQIQAFGVIVDDKRSKRLLIPEDK